jgi:hypothetical protein
MTTFLVLLSLFFAFTLASNIRGGNRGVADIEDEGIHHADSSGLSDDVSIRRLLAAKCPFDGGTVNFNVQTRVDPIVEFPTCTDATLRAIGVMINSALLNAGITTYDKSVFLAGVCNAPTVINEENNGISSGTTMNDDEFSIVSMPGVTGFVWTGGGVSCNNHLDIGQHL